MSSQRAAHVTEKAARKFPLAHQYYFVFLASTVRASIFRPSYRAMTTSDSVEEDDQNLYRIQVRHLKEYAIFFIDLDGRIKTWNEGVEHLLGYSEEEWLGSDTSVIFVPADKAVALRDVEMELARQQGCASDIRWHRRKDGSELFANGVMRAAYDDAGKLIGFTKIISDETSRKQLEDSLIESNSALEHFAYAASHDLQEPLRTIGTFADLIVRRYGAELSGAGADWLTLIRKAVARMTALVQDLLTYARVGGQKEEAVSLSVDQDLEAALSQLAHSIEESGAAVTHDPLPVVRAQRSELVRLFQNLIGNSIKYRSPERPLTIHVSAQARGDYWVVAVEDNGMGFAKEYAQSIFEPFKRLHGQEYSGSGVGLSICRRIVEGQGGQIWAESTLGKGSTFSFTLPQKS
jgi:PAS domain S-box-containing protein